MYCCSSWKIETIKDTTQYLHDHFYNQQLLILSNVNQVVKLIIYSIAQSAPPHPTPLSFAPDIYQDLLYFPQNSEAFAWYAGTEKNSIVRF